MSFEDQISDQLHFTQNEWVGLVAAGDFAAAMSFAANSIVLILHAFMLWYRPIIVARLSLRMIVLSCIFNMIYCACQLVTDDISSQDKNCRVLAYVLIVSDTMACICLAMVGLNLVMIFVLRVSRNIKLELLYYFMVLLCGLLVCIVPILVNKRGPPNKVASCWYHYYFDGRLNSLFNWIWYYSWLMFSSVFAACCAIISLAFVVKKQGNFAGTLDMFSFRDKSQISSINKLKRYSKNNTDVFKKIAKRCILYPLVPLISKSWGVGIVIAASQHAPIPYSIFVIDRIFSCLLGLMVSCIYYTDPAITGVFKEGREKLKKKYVYDYYSVKYQPGSDPSIKSSSQYPQQVKIVKNPSTIRSSMTHSRTTSQALYTSVNVEKSITAGHETMVNPHDDVSHLHPHMSNIRRESAVTFKPQVPSIEVHKHHTVNDTSSESTQKRFSVISMTSTGGRTFIPNESIPDKNSTSTKDSGTLRNTFSKRNKVKTIPMHRTNNESTRNSRRLTISTLHGYTKQNEAVETIVPYKYPVVAKTIHWTLVTFFRVSTTPSEKTTNEQTASSLSPKRVYRDFTDGSNPNTPPLSGDFSVPSTSFPKDSTPTEKSKQLSPKSPINNILLCNNSRESGSMSLSSPPKSYARSTEDIDMHKRNNDSSSVKSYPLRKVSSINVASLSKRKYRQSTLPTAERTRQLQETSSVNSSGTKFPSSLGLSKMFDRGRSMSFSLSKLPRFKKSAASSTPPKSSIAEPMKSNRSVSNIELAQQKNQQISKSAEKHPLDNTEVKIEDKPISSYNVLPVYCPFAVELSPRPVSREKTPSIKNRDSRQGSISKPIVRRSSSASKSQKLQRLSIFGEDILPESPPSSEKDDMEEESQSTPVVEDDVIQTDDEVNNEERSTSMEAEHTRMMDFGPKEKDDGLSEGCTTIDFISSWQERSSEETTRITVYSEAWDIEEQFRTQVELAEAIERI